MIKSFHDKDLEKFWLSKGIIHVKCVPSQLRQVTYRKLRELNRANDSGDLRNIPSNHFERLQGKSNLDHYSIRINRQYRLIFLWQNNQAYKVKINKHDKKY